jgi:serine/threonine protein kinase
MRGTPVTRVPLGTSPQSCHVESATGLGRTGVLMFDPMETGTLLAEGKYFQVYEHPWHGEEIGRRHVVKRAKSTLSQDPAFVQRLNRFADRLLSLQNHHIEDVTAVQFGPGDCSILCERLDGESLAEVLQRGVRPTLDDARTICRQIAVALNVAHTAGFFHGELSPDRILFEKPYKPGSGSPIHIKLRSFGLGKPLRDGLFGTPAYLAPEQVAPGTTALDPTPLGEQFVLAALLIEMLTGRQAFAGQRLDEVRPKLLKQDPVHIEWRGASQDDIRRVHRVLERALNKKPEQRYPQLSDFVSALEHRGGGSVIAPIAMTKGALQSGLPFGPVAANLRSELPTLHLLRSDSAPLPIELRAAATPAGGPSAVPAPSRGPLNPSRLAAGRRVFDRVGRWPLLLGLCVCSVVSTVALLPSDDRSPSGANAAQAATHKESLPTTSSPPKTITVVGLPTDSSRPASSPKAEQGRGDRKVQRGPSVSAKKGLPPQPKKTSALSKPF